jgi:N-acetylglutamate synthase-like GNAT family acetyltransferase
MTAGDVISGQSMEKPPDSFGVVREASKSDIMSIVTVHHLAFPGFFLTQLGDSFLCRYYRLVRDYPGGILLVAETPENAFLGFAAGFLDPSRFYSLMKKKTIELGASTIPALIKNPFLLRRLFQNFRSVAASSQKPDSPLLCELSSIAVLPKAGQKGYGKTLLEAFLDRARSWRAQEVYLTTDAFDNENANLFYLRSGFILSETFESVKGRRMNKYVLRLS